MNTHLGRILVVDDDEMNRDMLSRRLQRKGYDVETAADGHQALRQLDDSFDLVLLDIMMPGIDGIEVLNTIRQTRTDSELPVVMATAKSATDDVVEALNCGANDYVTKPLDMKVVLARVRTQISLRRAVQQLASANARLQRDLEMAAEIQQSQLPPPHPSFGCFDVEWRYQPCDELAGDFLNVVWLDDRLAAVYLLDVSGHGVSSALLSVAVNRALLPTLDHSSIVRMVDADGDAHQIAPPTVVADRLNRRFGTASGGTPTSQMITMIYGVMDTASGLFRYVNAGHPPLIHCSAGKAPHFVDDESGFPIGVSQPEDDFYDPYEEHTLQLVPGDRLLIYSDGVTECVNPQEELFEEERLLASLSHASDSLLHWTGGLQTALDQWRESREWTDDVSWLGLEFAQRH